MRRRLSSLICLASLAPAMGGCFGLGAERLGIDRSDYTQRLRDSEKAELLSNIVALRYGDSPSFLSVASVISQYTRETSGRFSISASPPVDEDAGNIDGGILLRETPTVTYTPMTGERFARGMLAPIPPASLLGMIEAGWAADDLFLVGVRSINGVRNGGRAPLFRTPGDPEFRTVVEAIRRLQLSGALSVRISQEDGVYSASGRLGANLTEQDRADIATVRHLLRLEDTQDLKIVFATEPSGPSELALTTRSMLAVLQELGQGIDVAGEGQFDPYGLIRIYSGPEPPDHTHVAVHQRGRWFWIHAEDSRSIRAFLLVQILISLNEGGGATRAPLVTIPAG